MGIGTWLAAMMTTLTAKVLLALGFQVVTITGVAVAMATLRTMIITNMGAVPAAGFQLALLSGVGTALGIVMGAVAFRLALWQIQSSVRILGVGA
jgi:hypothetical protein